MKINYVMTGIGQSGGSYVILEIIRGLLARGHDVTITTNNYGQRAEGIKLFTPNKLIDHLEYPIFSPPNVLLRAVRKIAVTLFPIYSEVTRKIRFLDAIVPDCDINVATDCFSAYPVFKSQKGMKFYHMQHYEPIFYDNPNIKELAKSTYTLPLNKIVNSIWLKGQMKEKYGIELPVINPAINHREFYPREARRTPSIKRVLCYGRKDQWKGFKDAIDAMKIVFKELKDVEWIVYGFPSLPWSPDAPYRHVGYLDHDKLAELYSSADMFFLPSWHESFPLQPLEAMACGIPVVTTQFGTEDYAVHEENSLVVPPRKPEIMADSIIRILTDDKLAGKLREEGVGTAKKFTWDKTVDKIEELFKNALK